MLPLTPLRKFASLSLIPEIIAAGYFSTRQYFQGEKKKSFDLFNFK